MNLNADGTISLPAMTLTTPQVDQLLHELALMRNQMSPEVAQEMKDLPFMEMHHNPHISFRRGTQDNIALGIRHRCLGWSIFSMDQAYAASVRKILDDLIHVVNQPDEITPPHGPH